jgi:hypothetical protein
MLEKSEIKAWVEKNILDLKREYGIPHWKLSVEYMFSEDAKWTGQCHCNPKYEDSWIEINCLRVEDLENLETMLRHELCHIVHSPSRFFRDAAYAAIEKLPNPEIILETLAEVYSQSIELTAKNLERMHAGHVDKYKVDVTS